MFLCSEDYGVVSHNPPNIEHNAYKLYRPSIIILYLKYSASLANG